MKDSAIAELHTLECGCCAGWYCTWCGYLNWAIYGTERALNDGLNRCGECDDLVEVVSR